jgi:hypothetical protein
MTFFFFYIISSRITKVLNKMSNHQNEFDKCPFPLKDGKIICSGRNIKVENLWVFIFCFVYNTFKSNCSFRADHLKGSPHHKSDDLVKTLLQDAVKLLKKQPSTSSSSTTSTIPTNTTSNTKFSSFVCIQLFTIEN